MNLSPARLSRVSPKEGQDLAVLPVRLALVLLGLLAWQAFDKFGEVAARSPGKSSDLRSLAGLSLCGISAADADSKRHRSTLASGATGCDRH
jgi:hypothetical protein